MRILALQDEKTGELTVFTVCDVFYDKEYKGIGFFTNNYGRHFYIPNVSLNEFNFACRQLATNGYCDVTRFGEIMEEEEE